LNVEASDATGAQGRFGAQTIINLVLAKEMR